MRSAKKLLRNLARASLFLMPALAGCGNSLTKAAPPSYQVMPANLTASRLPPLPGDDPGRLSWGESLLWNVGLLETIRQGNCDKALIRQIEQLRVSGKNGQTLPPPPECSLLNKKDE